jgi:hypothetical protein
MSSVTIFNWPLTVLAPKKNILLAQRIRLDLLKCDLKELEVLHNDHFVAEVFEF